MGKRRFGRVVAATVAVGLVAGCSGAADLGPPDLADGTPDPVEGTVAADDAVVEALDDASVEVDGPDEDGAGTPRAGDAPPATGPDASPPAVEAPDAPDPQQLRAQLESALTPRFAGTHQVVCPVTSARFGEHLTCEAQLLATAPPEETPLGVFVLFVDERRGYQAFGYRDGWRGPESMTADVGSQALCRDILAELDFYGEYPQLTLLAYWHHQGRPARMDATGDGIPCQTVIDGMRELVLQPEGRLG